MFQPGTVLNERYQILRALGQGGFSQTYEIEDLLAEPHGTKRVLKILLEDYPKAVDLFRRESKVLSLLDHPGIPRVEPDSYFTFQPEGQSQSFHCLVMERIPGINLHQWMSSRRFVPIGTTKAIDWLFQMVDILAKIHQCQCFHRDIKPSNIILRPNGQLALIDFGAVREVTQTYLQKKADDMARTHIYSRGYTPTEQMQGRAVPASDFFALGRTFVHLMTGCNPLEFPLDSHSNQLIWQRKAPQIIPSLARLINDLMAPCVAQRPRSVSQIYDALIEISQVLKTGNDFSEVDAYADTVIHNLVSDNTRAPDQEAEASDNILVQASGFRNTTSSSANVESRNSLSPSEVEAHAETAEPNIFKRLKQRGHHLSSSGFSFVGSTQRTALTIAAWICMVVAGISGLRLLGLLQGVELAAFDVFMQMRPSEPIDPRLLLITIDESDLEYQTQNDMPRRGSALADTALYRLLEKLEPHNPGAMGLDIYRFESATSGLQNGYSTQLADQSYLLKYEDLFIVCSTSPSIEPPSSIPIEKVGFVDMPLDPDRQIRRQILGMTPGDRCQTDKSISYQLATTYLSQQNIEARLVEQTLYLGDRPIPSLVSRRGGYYDTAMGGYEILLNYRKSKTIAQRVSLENILSGQLDQELEDLVENRLILIGTTAPSFKDYHETPYGSLSGVEIHAQMTSQLISHLLDDRPLISVWTLWGETLWILLWTGASVGCVALGRSLYQRLLGSSLLIVIMIGSGYLMFFSGVWLPIVPTAMAMAIASGGLIAQPRLSRAVLSRSTQKQ